MRELHVVALSEDGRHLVLAMSPAASRGGFRLGIDERLRAALRGELGRPGDTDWRPESALSPREIQARLRAGESPEELAMASGVPVSRIDRFSGPVLSERARVIEELRAAVYTRPRRGLSAQPLGSAVDAHLTATSGLRAETVTWTASRHDDGTWRVALSYLARGRTKTATWSWNPVGREVAALDPTAAALAYAEPANRRTASGADAARKRRAASTAGAKRKPGSGAPAKVGPGSSSPGGREAARARNAAAAGIAAPPGKSTPAGKSTAAEEPAAAAASSPREATNGARGRASVPGWADILLGAAPAAPAPRNGRVPPAGGHDAPAPDRRGSAAGRGSTSRRRTER